MVQHVPILVQRPLQAVQVFLDLCQHGGVVAHQVLGDPGPKYLPANGEVRVQRQHGQPALSALGTQELRSFRAEAEQVLGLK
jgi:hypothetical protein